MNLGTLSGLNNKPRSIISVITKVLPSYFAALFSCFLLALEGRFPALSKRRASIPWSTVVIVLLVIAAAVVAYFIIVSPSSTTTTVYP